MMNTLANYSLVTIATIIFLFVLLALVAGVRASTLASDWAESRAGPK
jgi:hypothetical protein